MKELTVEAARNLVGKRIAIQHNDKYNQKAEDEFVVGSIMSRYDAIDLDEKNRFLKQRWDEFLAKGKFKDLLTTFCLITEDGRNTNLYFSEGETYFQSRGWDNPVMYELV